MCIRDSRSICLRSSFASAKLDLVMNTPDVSMGNLQNHFYINLLDHM